MDQIWEITIAFFLIVSGVFGFVGSFGMIKLKDPMSRLHAPTKATTLGVGGVLIASILHSLTLEDHVSLHELLITLFLFIAKWHIHRHETPESLPPTGGDGRWATHAVEPDDDTPEHTAN